MLGRVEWFSRVWVVSCSGVVGLFFRLGEHTGTRVSGIISSVCRLSYSLGFLLARMKMSAFSISIFPSPIVIFMLFLFRFFSFWISQRSVKEGRTFRVIGVFFG